MIHWLWLIPSAWVGGAIGFFTVALCAAAKRGDAEETE